MSFVTHLACRDCAARTGKQAYVRCTTCNGQLDPVYDWDQIASELDRDALGNRPRAIWRFRELLPLDAPPTVSLEVGGTPLIEAPGLAVQVGVGRLWVKCDGLSFPSLSFKDRVVAVAVNKAIELGMRTVGCPSTGNLANAVAAHAARAGLESWILVPHDLESGKLAATVVYRPHVIRVRGTYDDANRLAAEAAEQFGWGMVNVNLRAYYGEGSKSLAFEIADELGWRAPSAIVAPMAGGSLVTKLAQGFRELSALGWIEPPTPAIFGAQAAGCAPIADAVCRGETMIQSVIPDTRAKSLAIGDPVDGRWAASAIRDTGGWAAVVDEDDIATGITLLAQHTGLFTEPAGGVTVSGARLLANQARLTKDDEVVLCLTGNGLKTVEVLDDALEPTPVIDPDISQLEAMIS